MERADCNQSTALRMFLTLARKVDRDSGGAIPALSKGRFVWIYDADMPEIKTKESV